MSKHQKLLDKNDDSLENGVSDYSDSDLKSNTLELRGQLQGRIIYCMMGIGLLFPWNAFLTAIDYFELIYPGKHVDRTFTVVYLPLCLFTIAMAIHFNSVVRGRIRVIASFIGFTLTMALVPTLDAATIDNNRSGTNATYALTCIAVGIAGVCDGFGQGSLFGETAKLTPDFTQALVQGTALSGIAVSLLRIITKASWESNERASAMLYFSISVLFTFLCVILFTFYLPNIPYIKQASRRIDSVEFVLERHPIGEHESVDVVVNNSKLKNSRTFEYFQVLRKIWREALTNVLIYVITLSIFPGFLTEDIESKALGSWYPVLLIFVFNIADFIGKSLPPMGLLKKSWTILISCILRVLFVPLFAMGAYVKLVDYGFFLLTFMLGVSNGFLTDLAMMSAPLHIKQPALQEIAGNIMVFALVTGLLIGAILGWVWLLF
eukprot:TRINITY_DN799_c0_g3_i6.p1 TRINITY_DN799_c0_g3~~TRINITY_DN799_c0_g3_i6.p1  ORF type:complete len:435 (+),score=37.55 TRINITY_DN799_c0_g3_i6:132-1436(+)